MRVNAQLAKLLILVGVLSAFAGGALAWLKPWEPNLLITNVYALPLEGEEEHVAEVFLDIHNASRHPDRLLSVGTSQTGGALLTPTSLVQIPVPASGQISLAPDSAHIRLTELDPAWAKDGALIPLDLTFEEAGVLRVQARMTRRNADGSISYEDAGLFGAADICLVGESEPAPKIALEVEADAEGYLVRVVSDEFEFTPHLLNGPHIPGTGHGHIYVGGAKLGRLFEETIRIGALPPGRHEVRVTLNTNDHRLYVVEEDAVEAVVHITVSDSPASG